MGGSIRVVFRVSRVPTIAFAGTLLVVLSRSGAGCAGRCLAAPLSFRRESMSSEKMAWTGPVVLILCVLAVGCGGSTVPSSSPQGNKLNDIHDMYTHYVRSHQKPPHQLSDLANKQYEGISPRAVEDLQKGKIIVVFDIQGNDAGTVMAYVKDAPTKGGAVLMANGTVRQMTAEEFKSALPGK
jgi:hypothetical protein